MKIKSVLLNTETGVEQWEKDIKGLNLFEIYSEASEGTVPDILRFLQRLIFKAAICCERVEYRVNQRVRARNAELKVLEFKMAGQQD